ncbi:26S proteasome non-ATPase regulatory subunit 5 isoform X2 [Hyalella azteca]|uniref:26S proteasome non-ATPase regulatory subunit 5 n=1 Tax=Hyalella azteca TaxID=294128 RepID=A0A8B7N078_HYAAZ|nr:26S proteasome non-ATPase regulatory subunit 5 isoform X2 [Hyalella azteca]
MGSLSIFIIENEVKSDLDNLFLRQDSAQWHDFYDECYKHLMVARERKFKISFEGALTLIPLYYNQVSSSDDDDLLLKGVHVLDQILTLCDERHHEECPDWHQILVKSSVFKECILAAVNNSDCHLQLFGVTQVLTCLKSNARDLLTSQDDVVRGLIKSLGGGVSSVSTTAKTALVLLCEQEQGLAALFSDSAALDALNTVMAVNDSSKFNVYEVVQRVCVLGSDQLSMVSNSGLLDQLVAEVSSSDTLSQLAALQLLSELMESEKALDHIKSAGVLHQLQTALLQAHSSQDSLAAMNIPGLLKVFGVVGRTRPELVCREHSAVVSLMLQLSSDSSSDPCLSIIALDTLVQLANTSNAKKLLHYNFRSEVDEWLKTLGRQLQTAPMEQRARRLSALVLLFSVPALPDDRVESDDLQELLQGWYNLVFPCGTLEPVDKFMRLPFPEMHLEAYHLLRALIRLPWGAKMVAANTATLKYLLDRSTESCKEGKELKYAVAKALLCNPEVLSEEAGKQAYDAFKAYVKNGPFYVEPYVELGVGHLHG